MRLFAHQNELLLLSKKTIKRGVITSNIKFVAVDGYRLQRIFLNSVTRKN